MSLSKNIVRVFSLIAFVFITAGPCAAGGWRGIVPLHSTLDDVHRILGKPTKEGAAGFVVMEEFHIDGANVAVMYSRAPCAPVLPPGQGRWNVPPNTVVIFSVEFVNEVTLAQLNIPNIEKFKEETDDSGFTTYRNRTDGFACTVNRFGFVESIVYGPPLTDRSLRCDDHAPISGT